MPILSLENYSVFYNEKTQAVRDVSFNVDAGEIVAIVGESGSGKSTILHGIFGMTRAFYKEGGKLTLFGRRRSDIPADEMKKMRGEKMAMIFQDTGRTLNPTGRIGRQFAETLDAHGDYSKEEKREISEKMLRQVRLTDTERVLRAYPFELSGGMRQRVGIALAMMFTPGLILADEPTSALDVTVQAQVVRQMLALRDKFGTAIIIVTHNMGVAAYMADKIGVMKSGELVEWGDAGEITTHPKHPYTKSLLAAVPEFKD